MLRLLFISLALFFVTVLSVSEAQACTELGCLAKISVNAPNRLHVGNEDLRCASESDEAKVRQRDEQKRWVQTPKFWRQFRSYAYKQLPKHQEPSFRAVWVAMPIRTSDGTIATVGVKGVWW